FGAREQHAVLIAQSEEAGWLEADDRHSMRQPRRERIQNAFGFAARFVDQTRSKKRAPAAKRPAALDRNGRARVVGLEISVERIHQQHDFARAAFCPGAVYEAIAAPGWKRALGRESGKTAEHPHAEVGKRRKGRR